MESLSSPAFKLQIPLDNSTGNIGITLSAKYTLVPRLYASLSKGEKAFT